MGLPSQPSWHGAVHLVGALLVFGGLPIACALFARRFRATGDGAWAAYSLLSGMAMLVVFIAANVGANGMAGLDGVAGLLQRASIGIGLAWMMLLASRYLRRPSSVAVAQRQAQAAG